MKFYFDGVVRLWLNHEKGDKTSSHIRTNLRLEPGRGLELSQYLNHHGIPTAEGTKMLTRVLVSGLAANIHAAHQAGHIDSAEHMREIIRLLEEQFILPATITEGLM